MSSRVISLSRLSTGSLDEIAEYIGTQFQKSIIEPELAFKQSDNIGGVEIMLLVWERYYARNCSYANLTVQLTDDGTLQKATVIGSGGGSGVLNLSFGANSSFAEKAADILQQKQFS